MRCGWNDADDDPEPPHGVVPAAYLKQKQINEKRKIFYLELVPSAVAL